MVAPCELRVVWALRQLVKRECRVRLPPSSARQNTLKSPEPVRNATAAIDATFERHNTAVAYLDPHSGSLPLLGWTLNYRSNGGRGKIVIPYVPIISKWLP